MTYRYALLTLLALATGVAFGHAELEGSTPEDGETLLTPPSEVALVFSESVELAFSTFKVYPLPDDLAEDNADPSAVIGFDDTDDTNESLDDEDDTSDGNDVGDDTSDDSTSDDDAASSDSMDDAADDDHAAGEHSHSADDDTATAAFVSDALAAEGDEAERVDEDATAQGSEITLTLRDDLPAGAYVAMWQALSSDGHTVEGYLTFSYQP